MKKKKAVVARTGGKCPADILPMPFASDAWLCGF